MITTVNAQNYGVGVPTKFTQQTSSSKTIAIQKGQLNNFRLRPQIANEHVETARQVQSVVTSTNIVGQIFKASHDNINGITLTMENAGGAVFDDFESYADDAALQAAWVTTGTDEATLETTIVYEGTQAMKIPASADVGDEWARTFASTNFTDYVGELKMYSTNSYTLSKMRVFVEDENTNTSSTELVIQEQEAWEHFEINVNSLVEDVVGSPADLAKIVKIGLRLEDRHPTGSFYIDEMISVPPPGTIDLELWDMGPDMPLSGSTSLDDGTQYTELGDRGTNSGVVLSRVRFELIGGKRNYTINRYIAGVALEIPENTTLNVGNYYAIVLRYVDTDVSVYGSNTSFKTVYYQNGYAFTAPDNSTAISQIGEYNDIQFCVFSTQDVYINTLLKFYDGTPGLDANENIYIEDRNMNIVGIMAGENRPVTELQVEFKDRTFYFPKGGKFEVNLNDDFTDDTTRITILIGYIFEPQEING